MSRMASRVCTQCLHTKTKSGRSNNRILMLIGQINVVQLLHGALHRFTSATMDAISSPPPHSISLGGLRTPAPLCAAPPSWGRHPKTFTIGELGKPIAGSALHRGTGAGRHETSSDER